MRCTQNFTKRGRKSRDMSFPLENIRAHDMYPLQKAGRAACARQPIKIRCGWKYIVDQDRLITTTSFQPHATRVARVVRGYPHHLLPDNIPFTLVVPADLVAGPPGW